MPMWWKCEVLFCRNTLRLKVWARSEVEARRKVERMYQLATIRTIALVDGIGPDAGGMLSAAWRLPESVVPEPLPRPEEGNVVL